MEQHEETSESLRAKAWRDRRTAEIVFDGDDELTDIACYHLQQYLEKTIKAKLLDMGVPYRRQHDILFLLEMIPGSDLGSRYEREASRITVYESVTRYSDFTPSPEETEELFRMVDEIAHEVESIEPVGVGNRRPKSGENQRPAWTSP